MTCKISLLLKFDMLGVFVNTLNADDKYPVRECENLLLPIQRQLSSKGKIYSTYFVRFLESSSNFKNFQEKEDCHRLCISEITDCQGLA